MPYSNSQKQKEYQHQHYIDNKSIYYHRMMERRRSVRNWVREYKAKLGCSECEERHPACLQFHHLDSQTKLRKVADGVRMGWSLPKLIQEIDKCIVLCANCHAKLHDKEHNNE
jgi:hypothetical protein